MKAPPAFPDPALASILKHRGFRVSWNRVPKSDPSSFGRRHFHLILLSVGDSKIHYKDHSIHLDGVFLFFANARVPYATEILSKNHEGYSCIFTDDFLQPIARSESLRQSPLFKTQGSPAFRLDAKQQAALTQLFETMIERDRSDYQYKDDLMRAYIQLIVHEALQLQPTEHFVQFTSASIRIATRFLELLERQFPVDDPRAPIELKSAQDFADRLSIHANYLNRSVKEVTGKSTTTLIAERIAAEAVTLLRKTDWSIADIAYALGFEYPNYFSNFFKKMTGQTPKSQRPRQV